VLHDADEGTQACGVDERHQTDVHDDRGTVQRLVEGFAQFRGGEGVKVTLHADDTGVVVDLDADAEDPVVPNGSHHRSIGVLAREILPITLHFGDGSARRRHQARLAP